MDRCDAFVGASLLAIAVCQMTKMLNVSAPSRASPLPHWIRVDHNFVANRKTCGSGL
ncbi:hypothetical protein PMI36_03225, partial [Pseudomonas sp. GM79]